MEDILIKPSKNKGANKNHPNRSKVVVSFVVLLIIFSVTGGFLYKSMIERNKKVYEEALLDAERTANLGKTDIALDKYNLLIKDADSKDKRLDLALLKVKLLINAERYEDALATAKKVELERKRDDVCRLIILIYQLMEENEMADDYYDEVKPILSKDLMTDIGVDDGL